jgi:hypothetical protein
MKGFFRLCGHKLRVFSCLSFFPLLPDHCLCIFNSLSCPSGVSVNRIPNSFIFLWIA